MEMEKLRPDFRNWEWLFKMDISHLYVLLKNMIVY